MPNGRVRLAAPLAELVTDGALAVCQEAVAAPAEEVARRVAAASPAHISVRTRLTEADRKRGRSGAQRRAPKKVPPACRVCGLVLDAPEREICDECLPVYDAERTEKLAASGKAVLTAMRASANDPAFSDAARAKRAASSRAASLAARAWEREHGKAADPGMYAREILPRIEERTVPELARLTGLSKYHCWKVRKGERRLHARFWGLIAEKKGTESA